jgi:putative transposase
LRGFQAGDICICRWWWEESLGETFSFYRLPLQHHKHLKSTNISEHYNEEIKRRTRVARIFLNAARCLRLIRALAVETMRGGWRRAGILNRVSFKRQLFADAGFTTKLQIPLNPL